MQLIFKLPNNSNEFLGISQSTMDLIESVIEDSLKDQGGVITDYFGKMKTVCKTENELMYGCFLLGVELQRHDLVERAD